VFGIATAAAACLIIGMDAAEYADQCGYNNTDGIVVTCNEKNHLSCQNLTDDSKSYCVCNNEDTLVYDSTRDTCVSKPEEDCRYQFYDGKYPKGCCENAVCIQSNSTIDGVCKCYEGYAFQEESGTCKIPYGSPAQCSKYEDCDLYAFLICRKDKDNTCDCDALSMWDPTSKKCVSKVGGNSHRI
jgi:hypothetical protein